MFDVFKIDIYGEPILLEAVQSLEAGKKYHSPRMVGYNEPERHTTQVSCDVLKFSKE